MYSNLLHISKQFFLFYIKTSHLPIPALNWAPPLAFCWRRFLPIARLGRPIVKNQDLKSWCLSPKKVPGLSCHGSQCHGGGTNRGVFWVSGLVRLVEANLLKGVLWTVWNFRSLDPCWMVDGSFSVNALKVPLPMIGNKKDKQRCGSVPRACTIAKTKHIKLKEMVCLQ